MPLPAAHSRRTDDTGILYLTTKHALIMSSNFALYLIGYIVVAAGVVYAMNAIGLGQEWIIAAALIMLGIGIVAALTRSKKGNVADAKAERMSH